MSEARITKPRRLFVEVMGNYDKVSFSELKKILVDESDDKIDITTLYRTIDVFKKQGLIHEVEWKGERYFFLSTADNSEGSAIVVSVCENCWNMFDSRKKLSENLVSSYEEQRLKNCSNC